MSMFSDWFEKKFKKKVRAWLIAEGVSYCMGLIPFRLWLELQPDQVQDAAPEMLRRAFALIADKWF